MDITIVPNENTNCAGRQAGRRRTAFHRGRPRGAEADRLRGMGRPRRQQRAAERHVPVPPVLGQRRAPEFRAAARRDRRRRTGPAPAADSPGLCGPPAADGDGQLIVPMGLECAHDIRARTFWTALAVAAAMRVSLTAVAQERDRAKIPDRYKWNLADIYPNEAAWRAAKDKLAADIPTLGAFKGKLGVVAGRAGRRARHAVRARQGAVAALRLRQHARRPGHARSRAPGHAAGDGAAGRRRSARDASFIEPEILKADKATIEQVRRRRAAAEVYRFYLDDVVRRAAHTLSDSEEKLLADAAAVAGSAVERLQHPLERRLPVSDGDAEPTAAR